MDEEDAYPRSLGQPRGVPDEDGLRLRWSGRTDVGRFRKNNEDAFLALTVDAQEVRYLGKIGESDLKNQDFLFAVSDGMGGEKSGEFASRLAVDNITRLLPRLFRQGAEGLAAGFSDVLIELYHRIHAQMTRYSESYEECRKMGATLSLGWFVPGWMYFGHVGDSRIYYLPAGGGMQQLTHDDSHVGWLRRQGQINEREQRTHPRKSILTKALGAGQRSVEPQVGAVACQRGDRFLFCSDGIVDGVWDRALERLLVGGRVGDALGMADQLVKEAIEGGSRDNLTAIVVDVI